MTTKPISKVVATIRSDIEKTHKTALFTIVSIKDLSMLLDYISDLEQLQLTDKAVITDSERQLRLFTICSQ